jgi:hypothetical protein
MFIYVLRTFKKKRQFFLNILQLSITKYNDYNHKTYISLSNINNYKISLQILIIIIIIYIFRGIKIKYYILIEFQISALI